MREKTEKRCGKNGKLCLNMENEHHCAGNPTDKACQPAPVCEHLGDLKTGEGQDFYPRGELISTFSFKNAVRYPISSTDCSERPFLRYAGCMTAGCGEPYEEKGQSFVDCECPTYRGPFQFGQSNSELACDLGGDNVWSAANTTMSLPAPPASDD